jgi:two-component system chemotaxis sensor kinase CheA
MDAREYLPMFIAECRENLLELNLAIVRLEERPDDRDTVAAVFRIAHSLKGMSGTMGFERMARLTHAMEDVFETFRERAGAVERDVMDVVLACLDGLSACVDAIDADGEERLDDGPLVERLHGLVRSEDEVPGQASATLPSIGELQRHAGERRLVHVSVDIAQECPMPGVRAYQAYDALARRGEVLVSDPADEALEGYGGRRAQAWVASDATDEELVEVIQLVPEIAGVQVLSPEAAEHPATAAQAADAGPTPVASAPSLPQANGERRRTSTTVRVDSERLDQLMHLMGELVVQRTRLEALAHEASVDGLSEAMQDLTRSSQALQAMVMQVRMIPVDAVFMRFPRLVRDLSTKLSKKVELVLTGQDTELDRTVVEALGDPLVHLVRNSLDHGLESPGERVAAGKPETGRLEISARHAGGGVLITVRDDGRGVDPARIAAKAAERGLIPRESVDTIDMPGAIELLFAPGFSTAEQTTDVSGRGVGMDAVAAMVRSLGGDVVVTSELGAGTVAQVRLPLTLAIISALLVDARGLPFALPIERVERTIALREHTIRSVASRRMLVLNDGAVPLFDLAVELGYGASHDRTHAVLVRGAERRIALEVDSLVGQRELVTRPLPDEVGRAAALSGGAVLSNGEIALVVDCDALAMNASVPAAGSRRLANAA